MTSRTWGPDGSGIPISTTNLNGIEADLDRALGNKYTAVAANYTMTTADKIVLVNGSAITVTLPDPTTVANNAVYIVKNITNNTNNLLASAGSGSPKIDNQIAYSGNTVKLGQYASATLVSDGTNWWSIGSGLPLGNLSVGVDSSNVLHYGVNGMGSSKIFGLGTVGSDNFAVGGTGDILSLSSQTTAIGTCTGQPSDSTFYGLRIGWSGSNPGRLWHKAWGTNNSWGWAPVTSVRSYATKTANYTLTVTDEFVVFNGASLTATLPDPTGNAMNGRVFSVKNINSSSLSVVSAGTSKTIDGAASVTVAQWGGLDLISDGTQWLIRSKI